MSGTEFWFRTDKTDSGTGRFKMFGKINDSESLFNKKNKRELIPNRNH